MLLRNSNHRSLHSPQRLALSFIKGPSIRITEIGRHFLLSFLSSLGCLNDLETEILVFAQTSDWLITYSGSKKNWSAEPPSLPDGRFTWQMRLQRHKLYVIQTLPVNFFSFTTLWMAWIHDFISSSLLAQMKKVRRDEWLIWKQWFFRRVKSLNISQPSKSMTPVG